MAQQSKERSNSTTSKVMTAAVGGLVVGLVANAGRKAVMQLMDASYGQWDEILTAEHDATLMMFDKIQETGPENTAKRKMLLMQLKHALTKHAHEEENVVYPTMREHGLTAEADELNREHGYVKQFLFELENMDAADPAWSAKVADFRSQIEEHMLEDEDELFPKLRQKLDEKGNKAVTTALNKEGFKVA